MPEPADAPLLVARVVVDVTGLDKRFDYLVPGPLRDQVRVGTMVRVELGPRRVGGWVVALGPPDGTVDLERLKPIAKVRGWGPPPEIVDLAEWIAWRWHGRVRSVLTSASPQRAVRRLPDPIRTAPAASTPPNSVADECTGSAVDVWRIPPTDDPIGVVRRAVEAGPAIVVVPSVEQSHVVAAQLRAAGMSVALLPDQWATAAGGVDVIVGTRPSVLAPCPGLGVIVVVDEHDEALQEERNPTWHARDVAAERARRAGVPLVIVSPSPTVAATDLAGRRVHRRSRNDERAGWPIVDVVDLDEEPGGLLSSRLIAQLRLPERRVVCVSNVAGRARRLACRACGTATVCEHCAATVHEPFAGVLVCGRCGTERPLLCQSCGSGALVNLRRGVTRWREELEAAAGRGVVEVTAQTEDEPPDSGVYVGTEAVLHRVRRADTVAFLDFDAELIAARYRAAEQAMALLVRAARLVGSRHEGGRLIVQTRQPRHEVLDAALHADPGRLAEREAARRRMLHLPPFGALALVSGAGAAGFIDAAGLGGADLGDDRWLVRAPTWSDLADRLARTPRPIGTRLRVAVDPPRE